MTAPWYRRATAKVPERPKAMARRLRHRLRQRRRPAGPAPGELRAVVYLPTWARWDVMRQRPQYLMKAFAGAGHPAYFVDPREPGPRTVDGVQIVRTIDEVPRSGVILYVHFAPLRELFDAFDDPAIVYDIHDDLTIYEPDEVGMAPERTVAAHHGAMVAAADVTVVSLDVLAERHRHEAPDLLVVENGVDTEAFRRRTEPPGDLPVVDGPIVGYHGALSYWFDFALVEAVARSRPSWSFVLVGPVLEPAARHAARLSELENVTVLGERPSDEIPAYVQRFDVGLIPFRLDTMTEAVSPLKMYESLAAGVPVVSTPLPAAIATAGVRTASGSSAFAAAIDAALADRDDPGFRAAATREADEAEWGTRIRPVLERLDELGRRRVPR